MRFHNIGLSFLALVIATASTPIIFSLSTSPGELRVLVRSRDSNTSNVYRYKNITHDMKIVTFQDLSKDNKRGFAIALESATQETLVLKEGILPGMLDYPDMYIRHIRTAFNNQPVLIISTTDYELIELTILGIDVSKSSVTCHILTQYPQVGLQGYWSKSRNKASSLYPDFYSNPDVRKKQKSAFDFADYVAQIKPDYAILEPTGNHYSRLWSSILNKLGIKILWVGHVELRRYRGGKTSRIKVTRLTL